MFLQRQETADLAEKGLKLRQAEVRVSFALEPAAALDYLLKERQTLLPFLDGAGVAAEQVKNSVRGHLFKGLAHALPQFRPLPHALQQDQSVFQGLGGTLVMASILKIPGCG